LTAVGKLEAFDGAYPYQIGNVHMLGGSL